MRDMLCKPLQMGFTDWLTVSTKRLFGKKEKRITMWQSDNQQEWQIKWLPKLTNVQWRKWHSNRYLRKQLIALTLALGFFVYGLVSLQEGKAQQQDNYQVFWANLHSHTEYSDGLVSPREALDWAKGGKRVQVMAVTDHAERLNSKEWEKTWDSIFTETQQDKFIALRGFEWSGDKVDAKGHICVIGFVDDYVGSESEEANNLAKFYQWISDRAKYNFVCQFNHPNLYSNTPFNFFRIDLCPEIAREKFALFEIGYHGGVIKPSGDISDHFMDGDDVGIIYTSTGETFRGIILGNGGRGVLKTNEQLFIEALDAGWHLAPTINEDNHLRDYGQKPQKTGIWIKGSLTWNSVMDALVNRRVFATEVPGFQVRFQARTSGETIWHWMGERVQAQGNKITFWVSISHHEKLDLTSIALLTNSSDSLVPRRYLVWERGRSDNPIEIKNGDPVNKEIFTFTYTIEFDNFPVSKAGERYYFLKIVRREDELIYTAPIWFKPPTVSPPTPFGRIAVTPPDYDDIGAVLRQMGVPFKEIPDEQVRNLDTLQQFDVLFLNCSKKAKNNGKPSAEALRRFVDQGGRVYASDWAFAYIYHAFPDIVQFFDSPESWDAYIGEKGIVKAEVVNAGLRETLGLSEIELNYDLPAWVPIRDVTEGVIVYLKGKYPATRMFSGDGMPIHPYGRRNLLRLPTGNPRLFREGPLAIGFKYGKGFVIFTTFHNAPQRTEIEQKLLKFFALRPTVEP